MFLFIIETINWKPLLNYLQSRLPVVEIKFDQDISGINDHKGKLLVMNDEGLYPSFSKDLDVSIISMQIYVGSIPDNSYDISLPDSARLDYILTTMLVYLIRTFHLEATIELKTNIPDLAVSLLHSILDLTRRSDNSILDLPVIADMFPSNPMDWFIDDLKALESDTKIELQRKFNDRAFKFMIDSESPMKIIVSSLGVECPMEYKKWHGKCLTYTVKKSSSETSLDDALQLLTFFISMFL